MKKLILFVLLVIVSCTPTAERLYNEETIEHKGHSITIKTFGDYIEKIDVVDSTLYEYKIECKDYNWTTVMVLPHFNEIWYYHGANAPFEILKFKRGQVDILVDTITNSTTLNYYQTKKLTEVVNSSIENNIGLNEKE